MVGQLGRAVADVPPELFVFFRPSVQPYLISQFGYDPAAEIATLRLPIMIIQGDRDIRVSIEESKRRAAAMPGARFLRLAGGNHMLRAAPEDVLGNLALYDRMDVALVPQVVPAIAAFVAQPAR
jgi:hypothetical protein